MLNFKTVLLLSLIIWGIGQSREAEAAIFGEDNRGSITARSPEYDIARSTAVAVLSSNKSKSSPGFFKIDVDSLSEYICTTEKFAAEPSLSYACTGFLVAPDLIATAGHCMVNTGESRNETETYCAEFSWMFDYHLDDRGSINTAEVPADKIYGCKETIYAIREESFPFRDFALVRLDRPVEGRTPLRLATGWVKGTEALRMIGYPMGMPAKISPGGKILFNDPGRQSFITNLDAFEGNSGSPVLNSKNEVVGLLIGGTPSNSFVPKPGATCRRYNRCELDGTRCLSPDKDSSILPHFQRVGSEVQRVAPLSELLRAVILDQISI